MKTFWFVVVSKASFGSIFSISLITVRIASCLFRAEFQFSTVHILNWARDASMRFAPYSKDHIIYILLYIYIYRYTYTRTNKVFHIFYGTIIWWDFFLSPTSLFDSFVAPPKQPAPLFLRLKCEDDHGTCHGQWFCEPCRLRLGRGSVSRMLLLPCANKAITSKMKAYACV